MSAIALKESDVVFNSSKYNRERERREQGRRKEERRRGEEKKRHTAVETDAPSAVVSGVTVAKLSGRGLPGTYSGLFMKARVFSKPPTYV